MRCITSRGLLAWGAVWLAVLNLNAMELEGTEPQFVDVFISGVDGYPVYRIPSLICTPKGVLLAFCEARAAGDQSATDLVLRRSLDGGKNWLPMQIVVRAVPEAAMDPTPVIDRTTGQVLLVYDRWPVMPAGSEVGVLKRMPGLGRDSITAWITTSSDEGATWSTPADITATTKRQEWTEVVHGPGVGIQMRSGRLVIPCFENRPGPASGGVCWNFVIYSDDHGRTWQLSENETGPGVNETQVVELIDGALLLNMRSDRLTGRRIGATSRDGGKTWSQPFDIPELPDPNCQGSILRCSWPDQDGKSRVLFCNPGVPWDQLTRGRHTGTIRLSYDEGRTWPVAKAINQYKSFFGYSCLTAMPDGSIGLLFEGNGCEKSTLPSKGIEAEKYHATFARFSLEWLTDGKDSWKGGK